MPKIKTKVGFRGHTKDIDVDIPEGEPAPWGADAQLKHVGTDIPRIDGVLKVSGRAKYTYDQHPPGMLWAKMLHSPWGAAAIKSLDVDAARAAAGVKGVYLFKDKGRPLRYHGDEILAIAAESEEEAEDALLAVKIEYDRKPVVTTVEAALLPGAALVFEGEQNLKPDKPAGDKDKVAAAIAKADKIVQATYTTQVQTHSSLETHGALAMFGKDGTLTVYCSTQATFNVKGEAVHASGLTDDKVRVLAEMVGGGFGSKMSLAPSGKAAIELAKQTKRPVKLMLSREGEHLTGGNRPSSVQSMKAGVAKDGKILGFMLESHGSGGVTGGAGVANPVIYQVGEKHKSGGSVYTNAGPAAAMRAPGHPQGIFALDSFLDELAHAIGMDPLELRRKNTEDEVYLAQWELGAAKIGWKERRNKIPGAGAGTVKRGIGMASSLWRQMGGPGTEVDVVIHRDGTVEAKNGAQDIGTGTRTLMATIVAEELGLSPSQIKISLGDTRWPIGPASGGSKTAPSIGPAARTGAYQAKLKLLALASARLKVPVADLRMEGGLVAGRGQRLTFAEACALIDKKDGALTVRGVRAKNYDAYTTTSHGCMFAEVEVDTESGAVRPIKLVTVQDAGRIIDKLLFESQMIGGAIQGISYTLHEQRLLDPHYGVQMNADMSTYKIAGPMEMPEIVPIAFDVSNAGNNCGMMGVGEPPNIPTAAAIGNAIFNATGARVRSLPITPDRMLAALGARPSRRI